MPLTGGLSSPSDDPLCKTVCFTAPSAAVVNEIIGGSAGDVRGELVALFGRLPNLGGRLLSESFRAGAGKMKAAQSAPELKWLLDSGPGSGTEGDAMASKPSPGYKGGGDNGSEHQVIKMRQLRFRWNLCIHLTFCQRMML